MIPGRSPGAELVCVCVCVSVCVGLFFSWCFTGGLLAGGAFFFVRPRRALSFPNEASVWDAPVSSKEISISKVGSSAFGPESSCGILVCVSFCLFSLFFSGSAGWLARRPRRALFSRKRNFSLGDTSEEIKRGKLATGGKQGSWAKLRMQNRCVCGLFFSAGTFSQTKLQFGRHQ